MSNSTIFDYITTISNQLSTAFSNKQLCTDYAWWILQALCNKTKLELMTQKHFKLTAKQQETVSIWLKQIIVDHKPLAYILGSVPFADLTILVEPPILIPRPETEEWCIILTKKLKTLQQQKITILDIATGSGCIALALAYHLPQAHVIGLDIAPHAIALAEKNKKFNNILNAQFILSDLFSALPANTQVDLIVSNPPYIAETEKATLEKSVIEWENPRALFAHDNGLAIIKKIITNAQLFLNNNTEMKNKKIPQLIIEIGYQQGNEVKNFMIENGYKNVHICRDLENKERWIEGFL